MYLYDASALAIAGEIRRPTQQVIENQASTCLAMTGGVSRAEVAGFHVPGIVSFRRAFAEVSGSSEASSIHHTGANVVVEGLNVLDIITADRVIARLYGRHSPKEVESRVGANGTHFENLRIAGQSVQIELATGLLDRYDTFAELDAAYSRSPHEFDRFLFGSRRKSLKPDASDLYHISLAEKVVLPSNLGTKVHGCTIEIPNFGKVYIGELFIQKSRRRLNMLRFELGSPVAGRLLIASASCNGLAGDSGTPDD